MPLERLRWIMFGHLESDECGAMNLFLAAAPNAQVAHTAIGCMVSINDLADRPPVPVAPDGTFDLGGRRIRSIDTPHVPHGWDAHVIYEETTGTLFCGDLLTQVGDGPALTGNDLLGAAIEAEDMFGVDLPDPADRAHHPSPGRARPDDARHHARLVVRTATPPAPSWPSPTSTRADCRKAADVPRPGRTDPIRRAGSAQVPVAVPVAPALPVTGAVRS